MAKKTEIPVSTAYGMMPDRLIPNPDKRALLHLISSENDPNPAQEKQHTHTRRDQSTQDPHKF